MLVVWHSPVHQTSNVFVLQCARCPATQADPNHPRQPTVPRTRSHPSPDRLTRDAASSMGGKRTSRSGMGSSAHSRAGQMGQGIGKVRELRMITIDNARWHRATLQDGDDGVSVIVYQKLARGDGAPWMEIYRDLIDAPFHVALDQIHDIVQQMHPDHIKPATTNKHVRSINGISKI